ncbi:MAG: GGDEF domain-containing protein [Pseudomonadales bacterium]|nr:GGDEF domain-containing protein [Pseudomonadales bacterium]
MLADRQDHKHKSILGFIRMVCLVILAGTLIRPLLIELPPLFTYLGVANVAIATGAYLLIRSNHLPQLHADLVMALGFVCILPLLFISGGVNSQFAYLLPCYPITAAVFGGNRLIWTVSAILIAVIAVLVIYAPGIPDFVGDTYIREKTVSRGLWLALGVIAMSYCGHYFQQANDQLTLKLNELATHDHLTGLLNRRGLDIRFSEELERQKRSGEPISLLLLDVDHFKLFNDKFGHSAGDRCLIEVGQKLRETTRSSDLVARFGGEEFLVILVGADDASAAAVAEKLRESITTISLEDIDTSISVTIGYVSASAATTPDREALIRRADRALYYGKENGRNQVISANTIASLANT